MVERLPLEKGDLVQSSDIARMCGLDSSNVRRKVVLLKKQMPAFMQRHSQNISKGVVPRTLLDRIATVLIVFKLGVNQDAQLLADLLEHLEDSGQEDKLRDVIRRYYYSCPKVRPDALS